MNYATCLHDDKFPRKVWKGNCISGLAMLSMAFELLLKTIFREEFEKKFYFANASQKEVIREG